jgi:uncharacterized glyoxalase superfamily protein PhnB
MANPIPDGFHTVSPHIVIKGAGQAIDWYKKAFGAEELFRMPAPDGSIMHAEIRIGDSPIMIAEEFPTMGVKGPKSIGGSPVTIHLYVKDVDKVYNQAVAAGATAAMPPADMFWGDRYGKLIDPYGHHWSVATHMEDLTPEQCSQRAAEFFANAPGCS